MMMHDMMFIFGIKVLRPLQTTLIENRPDVTDSKNTLNCSVLKMLPNNYILC